MSLVMHALDVLAATPPPRPTAPATAVSIRVGQAGEWFGPTLVLAAALILDWTALGQVAIRDRIAAAGYYAATISMIGIFNWSKDIQDWFAGSWSWQLAGSALAFIAHLGLVLAMIGRRFKWSAGLAKAIHKLIHMEHADSTANRINGTLLGSSAIAAATSVLARGPLAGFTHWVADHITGIWAWIAERIITGLGG